jgi:hypothetical protein
LIFPSHSNHKISQSYYHFQPNLQIFSPSPSHLLSIDYLLVSEQSLTFFFFLMWIPTHSTIYMSWSCL